MKRVLLIQHEAYEALGTLDPLLKREGIRIKYVNFERAPDATPSLDRYDGLILLGGFMGVHEADRYFHLRTEMKLVEAALARNLPILGICLGAQILAHVLGAPVRRHREREMGWYSLQMTDAGRADPVLGHFGPAERVFQSHGDTFEIPRSAVHLASSDLCEGQAFRHGDCAYGLQFHLETDAQIVEDWLAMPENAPIFAAEPAKFSPARIRADTARFLPRSLALSAEAFTQFLRVAGRGARPLLLGSGHRD